LNILFLQKEWNRRLLNFYRIEKAGDKKSFYKMSRVYLRRFLFPEKGKNQ
jgi:hypothetical protein